MSKVYSLYYSVQHGVGICSSEAHYTESGEFFFEDGTISREKFSELLYLSAGGGYYGRDDENLFARYGNRTNKAWEKGTRLFEEGRVTPKHRGKLVRFLVEDGKTIYTVHVRQGVARTLDVDCDCGASYCCHNAAVSRYFVEHIRILKRLYLSRKDQDHSLFLGQVMEEKLEQLDAAGARRKEGDQQRIVQEIIALLREIGTESYTGGLLEHLFSEKDNWGYQSDLLAPYAPLFTAMYLDPVIGAFCRNEEALEKYFSEYQDRQYKSNRVLFRKVIKDLTRFEKEEKKGEYSENPITESALVFLKKSEELLRYYAFTKSELGEDDAVQLQKIAAEYGAADPEAEIKEQSAEQKAARTSVQKEFPGSAADAVKRILKRLDSLFFYEKDRTMSMLFSLLKAEDAAQLLPELENFQLDFDSFRRFPPEMQSRLVTSMGAEPDTVSYILENLLADASDYEKAEYVFSALNKCCGKTRIKAVREPLSALLDSLPENGLLKMEAMYRYDGFPEDDTYDRLRFGKKLSKVAFTKEETVPYYTGSWELEESGGQVVVCHFMTPPGKALECEIRIFEFPDGKLLGDHLAGHFTPGFLQLLVSLNREHFGEEIDRQVKLRQEAILARDFASSNKGFIKAYDALLEELNQEKVIFTDSFKANLRYLLGEEDGKMYLAFRIGNVKDYVVKNAYEFLEAFRDRETVEYGKDLVLTHDPENMKPEDRPVLRMLTAMKFIQPKGEARLKRYLPVKGAMLANLLEMLEGRKITFLEDDCLIRLENAVLKARICGNGELSVTPDLKGKKFYVSDGKGFLFTHGKEGWVVDRIRGSAEEISFLKFVSEHGGISLRPIFPDFKKNLYSRFFDIIDVDPELAPEFKLNGIRINAYFDYDDRIITCREEFLREDKIISREDIRERIDLGKLGQFDAFLNNLGFVDGKIIDESYILNFFKTDFSGLKKIAAVYLSDSLKRKSIVPMSRQNVKITCKGNLMEAVLEKSEFSEAELEKILQALRKKKKFLLLGKDRLVDLDNEQARGFAETVKDLGLEPGKLYKKKQLAMVNALKAFAHEKNCSIDRHLRSMIEEIRTYREASIKAPALELPMRSYQEEGFRWMHILAGYGLGGILADDMGLGKTIQVIALLAADKAEKPDLVVCPKSLVFNWINEFARFAPGLETEEIYGQAAQRAAQIGNIDYGKKKVYITSYDSLRNDIGGYTGEFGYCILDEAQFIKNATALKSQSVKELKAVHRFALTGTPIENTVEDLWSIFDFLMPGYFEDLPEFRSASRQEDFAARIAAQIGPFVLRRVKENVLADLPQKYERILSTEMTTPQRAMYDALRLKANRLLEETGKAFDLLPYLMHLRQICVDPEMYADDYTGGSGKMELLEEMIPEYLAAGHRILLFSQFVRGLNQVEKLLKHRRIPYFILTGDTDAKKRAGMIEEFNSTEGTDVFLISLKAGGTGLNLTGADTVIHLDPWWNTAAENQATDRAHRIGQTRNVEVIRLIANRSIEQRVIELQNQKKSLIDQIISNDESSVINASLEDIRFVLQ